jgi:primosomal protein N' (replication factor Y)
MEFAEVVVPLPVRRTFTYRLPAGWRDQAKVGARLIVPFGKQQVTGYIVALHHKIEFDADFDESKLRDALELVDSEPLITSSILKLAQWISDYYVASWGDVLKSSLPSGLNAKVEQMTVITSAGRDELLKLADKQVQSVKAQILQTIAQTDEISVRELGKKFEMAAVKRAIRDFEAKGWLRTFHRALTAQAKPKRRKAVRLLPPEKHQTPDATQKLTEAQMRVVETLIAENGELTFAELLEKTHVSSSAINTLEKRGVVEIFVKEVRRDPLNGVKLPAIKNFSLTAEQMTVLQEIKQSVSTDKYQAFLLHGITGSGKTEVYIRAMRHALTLGKTALMLVPEIALTPVFSRRLRAHFGDEVAILHSSLSTGERFDEWRRIKNGAAKVVIGTRSAIFAPLENLGVIVVDEEHDGSYRQHESPFYHGRDAAVIRAHQSNAVIVLGSATPSLETFHNAQTGKYHYLSLPRRIGNRPLAQAEIIDMREEFKTDGRDKILSPQLLEAIADTHSRGEQSMILLNRRGFSQFVLCRSCGETIRCPNCDVTLTFHRREQALVCHYCNHRQRTPRLCPNCHSRHINFMGEGTEQIEDILQRKFSDLKIARIDRDTTLKKNLLDETLHQFAEHQIDMLVGTQMLAKGHDFPKVTLVGVVSVDAGLALPDFRAAERTFQLITQVAGRAGRRHLPGRVVIQTFYPEHYALRFACAQSYAGFYEVERNFRQKLGYPPFVALASLLIHHEDLFHATQTANLLHDCLHKANQNNACRILGPAPAPLSRIKNEHRLQILIKAQNRKKLRETIDFALIEAEEQNCDLRAVNLEIDPVNLL